MTDQAHPSPAAPAMSYPYESAGPDLGAFLRHAFILVRRNLVLIALIVLAAVIASIAVTLLMTPRYTATASIEINDRTQTVLGDELEGDGDQDIWDIERFLNTQVDLLESEALAERVASSLQLESDPRFFVAVGGPSPDDFPTSEARQRFVVAALRSNLEVSLPPSTSVAELDFTSFVPEVSAEIANAYASEFIESSLQRRFDSTAYARNFVSEQLAEARARLEASERELNDYARDAALVRTRDSSEGETSTVTSVTTESLSQLNRAANEAQAARVAAQARWEAEQAAPLLSSPAALASTAVQTLQQRERELVAELETARARYLPEHPTIRRLDGELAAVSSQLQAAAQAARQSVFAEYQAARRVEQGLSARVAGLQNSTLAEQDRAVRYNTLAREADTNRSIYEGLLQRFRELNATAGITSSNISIVDTARTPQQPSSPNLLFNLVLGLLFGILVAGIVLFLKDLLDDRIRVPEDVEDRIGFPLLGVVPQTDTDDVAEELEDPKTPISEAYGSLRASLTHVSPEGMPRSLLVTSAQAAEGKSTTSRAIAAGLASVGKRVLLIDADLRRPSLHRALSLSNEAGFSTILSGQAEWRAAVQQAELEGLHVITSGPLPPAPAQLLSSPQASDILRELSHEFDAVVIDSPPVLGLADAPNLAANVEGAIIVIEAERGQRSKLKAAIRRLKTSRAKILGVVLTKFDPSRGGNQYSSYYGYDYYRYENAE